MSVVMLPARCDRATAIALLPQLIAAMGSKPIEIDATNVEQIGQAVLQILVSARRSGGGAVITPSSAMAEVTRLTGLSDELFSEAQL
jgi:anti-anti-sigma regulatory factor